MYTRCSSLVAGEEVRGERRERDEGREGVNRRWFQTHLDEKEMEADGEIRQEDQKCVYEGRTTTREKGVKVKT